jgi:hypothetical protein
MRGATRAETWARLAAAGIVQGELPAPRTRSPWYVRLMQGGSGWAAALLLLMFAGGMFAFLFESDAAMLSVGVAACVAAAFVFRRRPDSDFAAQLGFAVSLAGQVLIGMGLWGLIGEPVGVFATAMAGLEVALFLLVPNFLHRVWSAWTAVVFAWLAAVDAGVGALVPGLLAGAFAWVWLAEADVGRNGERLRAAGWGLALAILQLPGINAAVTDLGALSGELRFFEAGAVMEWAGAALSAAVLVGVVARLLTREGRSPATGPGVVALGGAAVLGLAAFEAPGLAPAVVVLVVGFAVGSRELAGFGIFALLAYLARYYYVLHTTLLVKAVLMLAVGGALLLAWLALRRLWPRPEAAGRA